MKKKVSQAEVEAAAGAGAAAAGAAAKRAEEEQNEFELGKDLGQAHIEEVLSWVDDQVRLGGMSYHERGRKLVPRKDVRKISNGAVSLPSTLQLADAMLTLELAGHDQNYAPLDGLLHLSGGRRGSGSTFKSLFKGRAPRALYGVPESFQHGPQRGTPLW